MERVNHKKFGEGVIIDREENRILVRFDKDGCERRFSIPESFNLGVFELNGNLKKEVEAINEAEKVAREAAWDEIQANIISYMSTRRKKHSYKKPAKCTITCSIEQDFQTYLIKSGYKEKTDAGKPSTVSAYIKAVNSILQEEQLTWHMLITQVSDVVSLYDINGAKAHLGDKSNKTWINALRRFKDFVNNSTTANSSYSATA